MTNLKRNQPQEEECLDTNKKQYVIYKNCIGDCELLRNKEDNGSIKLVHTCEGGV